MGMNKVLSRSIVYVKIQWQEVMDPPIQELMPHMGVNINVTKTMRRAIKSY